MLTLLNGLYQGIIMIGPRTGNKNCIEDKFLLIVYCECFRLLQYNIEVPYFVLPKGFRDDNDDVQWQWQGNEYDIINVGGCHWLVTREM